MSPHSNGSDCGYSSSMEGSETGSREGSDIACSEGICNHDEAGQASVALRCLGLWTLKSFQGLFSIQCSLISFLTVCFCLPSEGEDPNVHHCAEDKEEDGIDSCVDCWQHSEENTQCKSKKKKRKGKGLCNDQVRGQAWELAWYVQNILSCLPIKVCMLLQGQKCEGSMSDGNTTGHSPSSMHTCRTKEIFSSLCGNTFASIALRLPWTVHQKNLSFHTRPPEANISLVELLVSEKCLLKWLKINFCHNIQSCLILPLRNPLLSCCVFDTGWFRGELWRRELSDTGWNPGISRKKPILLQQPQPVPTAPEREIHRLLPRHWAEEASLWKVVCHHQCQLTALMTSPPGKNTRPLLQHV